MTTTPTSGEADLPEALHRVIDDFERRERGIPQAHIAAALVTELRAALTAQAISAEPAVATDEAEVVCAEAQQVDASPSAASIAWKALRDLTDPLDEAGTKIMGHVRVFAQRQYEAGRATHGQAPAQPVDFTTLGAAMRAIQQAIGLIGDPADERMQAVRRVLRGAVVVAEDSGDIPAQPDCLTCNDHGAVGNILTAEPCPDCTRWNVQPARADSVQEDLLDAAFEAVRKRLCGVQRYSFVLDDDGLVRRVRDRAGNWIEFDEAHALLDPMVVDAARKQGEKQ